MDRLVSQAQSGIESAGAQASRAPRTIRASPPRSAPTGANFASGDAMAPTVLDQPPTEISTAVAARHATAATAMAALPSAWLRGTPRASTPKGTATAAPR